MDGGAARSTSIDETQCADFSLFMAVFTAGRDTGDGVLEKHDGPDVLLFVVHNQLPLVVWPYCSIQVPTLAFFKQEGLVRVYCCIILRQLVRIH